MWTPTIGAWPELGGARFAVWAPAARRLRVDVVTPSGVTRQAELEPGRAAVFGGRLDDVPPGSRYAYAIDDRDPLPDVASRFQPDGVHAPSELVDASAFRWTDDAWTGVALRDLVIYELHVGTFSPEGTFDGVRRRLPYLCDLGVTALELMPIADFPGRHNWGYDGVSLYAPARVYGRPDDLRRLVDDAHAQGLAVLLDVVYNHLGPDGNYLGAFSPFYFDSDRPTPWGAAINMDGEECDRVRAFFIENALYWIHEFHVDGLRLDATHAISDEGPRPFLAELSDAIRASCAGLRRRPLVIAEDSRNLARLVRPTAELGSGMDAVWADDFHHQVRVALTGEQDGYYRDYAGRPADIAATIRQGWFYCGQPSAFLARPRGSNPAGLAPARFVICLQNHDQVGNRAFGDRLHHTVAPEVFRAASVLLLCSPQIPLIFMGQEWAAASPFQFFADHHAELGPLVTEGRRREFARFAAFADPDARRLIPDPQALGTFLDSRLNWDERQQMAHAPTLRLYRALLRLRHDEPALGAVTEADASRFDVHAEGDTLVLVRRPPLESAGGRTIAVAVHLRGAGVASMAVADAVDDAGGNAGTVELMLSTEQPEFAGRPMPVRMEPRGGRLQLTFARPGAVVLAVRSAGPPS